MVTMGDRWKDIFIKQGGLTPPLDAKGKTGR